MLSNRTKPSILVLFATFSFLTADEIIMTYVKLRANLTFLDHISASFVFKKIVSLKTRSRALSLSNSFTDMLHAFWDFWYSQRPTNIKLEPSRTKAKLKTYHASENRIIIYPLVSMISSVEITRIWFYCFVSKGQLNLKCCVLLFFESQI